MKLLDKLERKFGHLAIPNLTVYIVACYVIGYFLSRFAPGVMSMLGLDVHLILRGQIWRLVTWVLFPPGNSNVFLFLLAIFFFYYPIGTAMERTWGSFRYTLYIFSGMLFTILGAFLLYGLTRPHLHSNYIFTTYYISLSVFLAYAVTYPEQQFLLWFVIPLKAKWFALIDALLIGYDIVNNLRYGIWYLNIPIIASILNFLVFFLASRDMYRFRPGEIRRKREFRKAMEPMGRRENGQIAKHKCAICGRTDISNPELDFRFCSRCNGNYEYCQDHLFTHKHVQ